jgi:HD-GYP domain-containing protein (c-di-GMP phosphodiesterase class II)
MISQRPYSPAKRTQEAIAELRRCAGTQFDPALVAVFEQILADRAASPVAAGVDAPTR